ncbi:thiolase family protein [Mechercharimyces sp. CAU 1602]|uniref:thiolase family protein n=1 Tax=Mechercharimyces sp. CAU 1602 TaxID=2973933 RepID=UPI0021612384|nr:thiolase family protein [Mechercharimyces sp. CAU 1602]MCS1351722.1 thiolase family protein [Mechercharimyces sp. CAU 1602]
MREAVIVDAVRTPIGRFRGSLREVRPDDMAAHVLRALIERNPTLPLEQVEDVFFGCTNQAGEDNRNVARMSLLLAGFPQEVAGVTVNRLCGSGLEAVNQAVSTLHMGCGDAFVAGGVESMTRAPLVMLKPEEPFVRGEQMMVDTTLGWRFVNRRLAAMYPPLAMGETAENVAKKFDITREEQDEFALQSQKRATEAWEEGRFSTEVAPITVIGKNKDHVLFQKDEHIRPYTDREALAKLKPAFTSTGTVTAGNSSGINDGAAALIIMERKRADSLGLRARARIVSFAVAGTDPDYMGMGPVYATKKLLHRTGISSEQIDLIECNEAFAAQTLAVMKVMEWDPNKVNVNGGAIALGHPLGASGARLVTTLVHELERRQGRYGLVTMCIGVGQGIATLIERIE